MQRFVTWNYGGGTQSAAIAVLIAQGRLPAPECVVIADTGREATETWEYTDQYIRPLLRPLGVEIEVAPHSLARVDLYDGRRDLPLIPAWMSSGMLRTFCSNEWKARVCQRYYRQKGYGPRRPIVSWLGMSVDELGRIKHSRLWWQQLHWPLALDFRMTRADCRRLVLDFGLPEPPRSSCWMCPWRRNSQWRRLRDHYPGDWSNAVALDREIRERDPRHDLYLHRDRVPLDQADLDQPYVPPAPLFGDVEGCESGYCFV